MVLGLYLRMICIYIFSITVSGAFMRNATIASFATALTLALPASAQAQAPLQVMTTIGMLTDLATQLGGECAQVTSLLGAGSDPHLYRPSAGDIQRLSQAEVIFYVDPALEARLADVLARLGDRVPTLGVASALPSDQIRSDADGARDPHIWMDVGLWARIAPPMVEILASARPDCSDTLRANLADAQMQLAALDGWTRDALGTIPDSARILVTAHDAFGYFSAAYGMRASEAIEGISTESEASIADIRAVAAFIAENNVPAVFPETTINPRTIDALASEVRATGRDLTIGQPLFSDAMGDSGTAEGTYIGMIRSNVVSVVTALGGTLPEWPAELGAWAAQWGIDG
jgi:manganese/zinc/iron transport system substrate-binding protein